MLASNSRGKGSGDRGGSAFQREAKHRRIVRRPPARAPAPTASAPYSPASGTEELTPSRHQAHWLGG
eukprot:773870-Pyramimonas_sp.AAC.1